MLSTDPGDVGLNRDYLVTKVLKRDTLLSLEVLEGTVDVWIHTGQSLRRFGVKGRTRVATL